MCSCFYTPPADEAQSVVVLIIDATSPDWGSHDPPEESDPIAQAMAGQNLIVRLVGDVVFVQLGIIMKTEAVRQAGAQGATCGRFLQPSLGR
jgi:hypothetical protein